MLKGLAVVSFLLGVVVIGCAAIFYFQKIDPLERERQDVQNKIVACDDLIQASQVFDQMMEPYADQVSPETKQAAYDQQIQLIDAKNNWVLRLQDVNQRIRSTKRGSMIGGAIGLFFCLIQAPFLLVAGKQS